MFRKIVSQLSFSPALVGQLSFYAKRLRKEQLTRRVGLIFVALALVVQSLVVFQAPEPANASNNNDMVVGGLGYGSSLSINNYLAPYDRNERYLKDITNQFGITREEIANAKWGSFRIGGKKSYGFEDRAGSYAITIRDSNYRAVTTLYGRLLDKAWGNDPNWYFDGYIGHSAKMGWFAILQSCGNLVTDVYPPTPQPPKPANIVASKSGINVTRGNADASKVAARENDKITYTVSVKNTGEVAGNATLSDNISSVLRYAKLINSGGGTLSGGTLSWGTVSVAPGQTVTRQYTVQLNDSLISTTVPCSMTNTFLGQTVTTPVECKTPPANIVSSKTATNNSQNHVDATKVTANENNIITYTVTAKNTGGTATGIAFYDDLSDVLKYSKLTNDGGGTFNSKNGTLSWGTILIRPGATVTKQYSVRMNSSLIAKVANCSMKNDFLDKSVIIKVGCQTPPANIVSSKTAVNNSQKNVDATKVSAKKNDKITYTVTVKNTGGTKADVTMNDDLSDVLKYSKLTNNGGGKFDSTTKILSWGKVTVNPGATVTKTYTIQMNGSLENSTTDCSMKNNFLDNSVVIDVDCSTPPAKIEASKSAINVTQKKVNATKTGARAKDVISYTVTVKNTGGTETKVDMRDDLSAVLQYASLTNTGGGTLNKTTKELVWGNVSVAPGKSVTKTYTVQMNSSLLSPIPNCSMRNDFMGKSVTVDVGCSTPPANIKPNKTAKNVSQGNVDATTVTAKENDRITFTLTAENTGGTAKDVTFTDTLSDALEYAKLIDNGGGTFNEKTKILSWPTVSLKPGAKEVRTFTMQILSTIPATPAGLSDPSSYDCKIENAFFGAQVIIPVTCAPPKVIEQTVSELPKTGAGQNMIFAGILFSVVVFFYYRSKQLGTEVRLIRRDINGGTI